MANQTIICGDCVKELKKFDNNSIDIVPTSTPYNLDIKYNDYKDNLKRTSYLSWLKIVFTLIYDKLKDNGSFFLNVGSSNKDPWVHMDVANIARKIFILQNDIVWIKSIAINNKTYGHFKPINSTRFLNHTYEHLFHLTKKGNIPINRKAIGVPYVDKSNIKRFKGTEGKDLRCKGNCWFIPYETIKNKKEKGYHPATFPKQLVIDCIKLHGYTKKTMLVDPFCGSGTALYAAKELGISAIGIEIDKFYVDYINKKLKR